MSCDALVIGAGPAGSTTAILLARAGWSVAIVEKCPFPRPKVCGEFISATTVPTLDSLGLGGAFRDAAGPEIRRIGLLAKDTALCAAMPTHAAPGDRWGRALGREKLDMLLLERARSAGAQLWQPYAAVGLRAERGLQRCKIATRDREVVLRARIVVAAHGSWERGALPTQLARPHRDSDLLAFKARFHDCDLSPDLMPLLAFPGGYGGMVQSDAGRATLSLCIRRDALREARKSCPRGRAAVAVFEHLLAQCRGLREILRGATLEGPWLSAGPIRPGIGPGYASDVFRAGNAAGEAHPIIAEGISMAIQSADLLARQLIAAADDVSIEDRRAQIGAAYAAEWRRRFASRIHAAGLFAQLAMRGRSAGLLLPVLRAWPELLTLGGKLSGKATARGSDVDGSVYGGGGGNRTRVRKLSAFGSTCLVRLLF